MPLNYLQNLKLLNIFCMLVNIKYDMDEHTWLAEQVSTISDTFALCPRDTGL